MTACHAQLKPIHFREPSVNLGLGAMNGQLPPDPAMEALITQVRARYEAQLPERLAVTDGLLYRRGNFNRSRDPLICDALRNVQGADLAFSSGLRMGNCIGDMRMKGRLIAAGKTYKVAGWAPVAEEASTAIR